MERVCTSLVRSGSQTIENEVVTMPFIPRPSSSNNIRPRKLGHLCAHEFSVNKKLHLHSIPRLCVVNNPTRDRSRLDHYLSPTMKRWWKRVQIDHDRNRPHKNRLED